MRVVELVLLPLYEFVLNWAAGVDEGLTGGVAEDHSLALPCSNLQARIGRKYRPGFLSLLCGTNAHLLLDPPLTESVAHIAVLRNRQQVQTKPFSHAQRRVGVKEGAELVPPQNSLVLSTATPVNQVVFSEVFHHHFLGASQGKHHHHH